MPQAEERRHDRQQPDEERQQRGDRAAKDHQREDEEDREGERLGLREVLGDLLADLRPGDGRAAGLDPGEAAERRLDALAGLLAVVAVADVDGEKARMPVARDERARRPRVVQRGARLRDARVGGDELDDPLQRRAAARAADGRGRADEDDDPGAQRLPGRGAQLVARDAALGRRIDEVHVGLDGEHPRHRYAEPDGDDEEEQRRGEDAAGVGGDDRATRRHDRTTVSDHSLTVKLR